MLMDGFEVLEGGVSKNFVLPKGTVFPSSPNFGELFYRTDLDQIFVYESNLAAWTTVVKNGDKQVFVPTVYGLTTPGTTTYSLQSGSYVRNGTVITFSVNIVWTASDGTGDMAVGTLPFQNGLNKIVCNVLSENITYPGQLTAMINNASAEIRLVSVASASASSYVAMQSAGTLFISGTYSI